MSDRKRRAGDNIRALGAKRKRKALLRYAGAAGTLVGVVLLFLELSLSGIGILFYVSGIVLAIYLYRDGQRLMVRAAHAYQGARAEGEIAELLTTLAREGWQIEYNVMLSENWDADVVLRSPGNKWYVVDVKSHGGDKIVVNGKLKRRYGDKIYEFEKNLTRAIKGQAATIRNLNTNASWVTPLLCFTQGKVDVPGGQVDRVYVVSKYDLVDTLLAVDQQWRSAISRA